MENFQTKQTLKILKPSTQNQIHAHASKAVKDDVFQFSSSFGSQLIKGR
jgi:hypothetical protein